MTFTTPTIDNCGAVTQNGGTITGGIISNTTATAALVIDDDTAVSDVTLENNAIGIDATAAIVSDSVDIDGCLFSGNTTDVTVNSANNIDINMLNGANATTCTNTGAGSCTIVNDVTLTFTNMRDNTEVRIYAAGTSTELDGIENATAGSADARTFAATVSGSTSVDYTLVNEQYEIIRVEGFTWPTTDQSVVVQQRFDRNFSNPV